MKRIKDSTWKRKVPRGKHHNKTAIKTTVSLYLNRKLVERARNRNLNISRVTENALNNILSQIETQNSRFSLSESSLSPKEKVLWWAGQDLNLRPQPRKGCVLTRLDDRPLRLPPIGYTDVY
jgi:hypothetical protein